MTATSAPGAGNPARHQSSAEQKQKWREEPPPLAPSALPRCVAVLAPHSLTHPQFAVTHWALLIKVSPLSFQPEPAPCHPQCLCCSSHCNIFTLCCRPAKRRLRRPGSPTESCGIWRCGPMRPQTWSSSTG